MPTLLHDLINESAAETPDTVALTHKSSSWTYADLADAVSGFAQHLATLDVRPDARVGIYLPKQFETVVSFFAASYAGCVFVPINPVLTAEQVAYIMRDCNVQVLVTGSRRLMGLAEELTGCPDLRHVLLTESLTQDLPGDMPFAVSDWPHPDASAPPDDVAPVRRIDTDMAAILYTSGSTGRPKGVVLSHRNMLAGAASVAEYLGNSADDRLLAVLPFSFDYGLSQLTTAFLVGASVVLMDYLLPRDVIKAVAKHRITGLAAVPPLWNQIADMDWPEEAVGSLRYITNSGGAMPLTTTQALRAKLPHTQVFLMYGLTEAFRSTYLDPTQVDQRPDSMGKAIPNARIMVVRPDGTECEANEPGELVHRGSLVSMGYWNDPEKTAQRFKPAPGQISGVPLTEIAVWSGDKVRRDEEGFLYFIGRDDEMIKTSGYRVSPTEVEEVVLLLESVAQAVAFGAPHPTIGQGIVLIVQRTETFELDDATIRKHCQGHLPLYMIPGVVAFEDDLPRNPNGKIDRKQLAARYTQAFQDDSNPA